MLKQTTSGKNKARQKLKVLKTDLNSIEQLN
jgi:hypothetical protein